MKCLQPNAVKLTVLNVLHQSVQGATCISNTSIQTFCQFLLFDISFLLMSQETTHSSQCLRYIWREPLQSKRQAMSQFPHFYLQIFVHPAAKCCMFIRN